MQNKKHPFIEIITKADWIKIIILFIFSSVCWIWVYYEAQKPFEYGVYVERALENAVQIIDNGDQKIVKNNLEGYQVTIPNDWNIDKSDARDLFFSVTPLEMGSNRTLYEIASYNTNKTLEDWINSKEFLEGTKTTEEKVVINGIEGVRISDTIYIKNNNKTFEIKKISESEIYEYFDEFLNSFELY